MKSIVVAILVASGVAQAADVVVNVRLTVKDAARVEMANMLDSNPVIFPPLYSNALQVTYSTNSVRVVDGYITNMVEQVNDGVTNVVPVVAAMEHQESVVSSATNTVRVIVPETQRQRLARLSIGVLERYWRQQLRQYRQNTQPVPVNEAPVTGVEL